VYALQIFYNVGKVKCDKGQKAIAEAAYRRAIASVILFLLRMIALYCEYIIVFIQNMIKP
jgi:hypothetical protein